MIVKKDFMSEKKKQHFIPRFYLKNFSYENDGKSIGIWLKGTNHYIKRGNLKNQAYCNYFYGKDVTLENELSELEDNAASIIFQILLVERAELFRPVFIRRRFHGKNLECLV